MRRQSYSRGREHATATDYTGSEALTRALHLLSQVDRQTHFGTMKNYMLWNLLIFLTKLFPILISYKLTIINYLNFRGVKIFIYFHNQNIRSQFKLKSTARKGQYQGSSALSRALPFQWQCSYLLRFSPIQLGGQKSPSSTSRTDPRCWQACVTTGSRIDFSVFQSDRFAILSRAGIAC